MAGEASADLHGSRLVRAMKGLKGHLRFAGIGGPLMAREGARLVADCRDLAVVGLTEVAARLPHISLAYLRVKRLLREHKPALFIPIDYPGFNIRLSKVAKDAEIPVLYYIAPQVWAWRQGRVKKIKKRVDRVAVILPFEEAFYRRHGVRAEYVGHPLLDMARDEVYPDKIRGEAGLDEASPILALIPGSRAQEVEAMLPSMLETVEALQEKYPTLGCILPLAPSVEENRIKKFLDCAIAPRVALWRAGIQGALAVSDAALVTSGTATLETAIMGVPMVVLYKVSPLTFWMGKKLVRVRHISLVNLVAGKGIVPELIQEEVNRQRILEELLPLLEPGPRRDEMISSLGLIKEKMGGAGASMRVARMAVEMLNREV